MIVMKTLVCKPDVPNARGITIPGEVWDNALREFNELVVNNTALVLLGPASPNGNIDISQACAVIQSIDIPSKEFTIKILETPAGKTVQSLLESNIEFNLYPIAKATSVNDTVNVLKCNAMYFN